MPQQVQLSPSAPDTAAQQRPQRERELRVQANAGTFGMLLGALQAGEAGIVRGEARNDSAAEWNAQDAREGRQKPRDGAQDARPGAQESRDALGKMVQEPGRQPGRMRQAGEQTVERSPSDEKPAGAPNEGRPAPQQSTSQKDQVAPAGDQRTPGNAEVAQPRVQAAAAPAAAVNVSAAATSGAGTAPTAQNSQASGLEAARGPQGGAARGRARSPLAPRADQALRFEKVFQSQVGRGLAQALRSGDGEVTLRLRPESLGQLSVRVRVAQNQVTATFEAHNAEAKRMLEGSRHVLREQLEGRGLTVERIEIRMVDQAGQTGTPLAMDDHGGANGGQDGHAFSESRDGRGSPGGDGADGGSRRGATREDDERSVAGAEPWRSLGTVRLNAIA